MNEKAKCKNCTDEMIEEMKQILVDYALKYDLCFSFEVMRKHAEVLIKAGYRNCKDKVVLTKEEYNELKQYQRCMHEIEEVLDKVHENARKETAKTFAKELREFIYLCEDMKMDCNTYEKISNKIDEIAKKYGVRWKNER